MLCLMKSGMLSGSGLLKSPGRYLLRQVDCFGLCSSFTFLLSPDIIGLFLISKIFLSKTSLLMPVRFASRYVWFLSAGSYAISLSLSSLNFKLLPYSDLLASLSNSYLIFVPWGKDFSPPKLRLSVAQLPLPSYSQSFSAYSGSTSKCESLRDVTNVFVVRLLPYRVYACILWSLLCLFLNTSTMNCSDCFLMLVEKVLVEFKESLRLNFFMVGSALFELRICFYSFEN